MNTRSMTPKAGAAKPLIIGAIAVGLIIVAAVVWLLVTKVFRAGETGGPTAKSSTVEQELDDLKVGAPSLDFSVSPLSESGVSSFDLGEEVSGDLYSDVSVRTNFDDGSNVSLSEPTVSLDAPTDFNIEAPSAPPSGGGQGSSGSAPSVDAATCAQFSGVPSCSYISDPNGQALCGQCKSAGF